VSNTLEIAKKIINNIRSQFMFNEDFRYFFPEFCPKQSKEGKIEFGTTENFTVPNRTKSIKEPTMMCAGVGTNLTGLHFDYMKIDDLVTRESVSNDTQIQASKDYYSSLRQLFDNPTLPKEDVIGTTYHFADLYAGFKGSLDFEQSFVPVQEADGTINFFERFSLEGINSIRNDPTVGPYEFNAQYMLNPINPAEAKFKEEWWKTFDNLPVGLAEHILVDPASTQKKKSDYTVVERWGVDFDGNCYLIEGFRDRLTVFQRIDLVTEVAKRCKNLKQVKYEVLGGRHGDLETLKERFYKERITISPNETKATTASKKDRVEQRLVGQFHSGKVFFPQNFFFKSKQDGKTYDFVQLFRNEYLQFPYCEHDDALDCMSQLFEGFIHKGDKVAKADVKTNEFEWWRQKAITRKKEAEGKKHIRYIFGNKNRITAKIPYMEAFK
jgi:phage terminase large subunit-like protein